MGLFKFLPPDRIDVIRDGKIRFTQPGAFDDPFEFKPDTTYSDDDRIGIPQMAPRGATGADIAAARVRAVVNKAPVAAMLLNELNKKVCVLSLGRSPRNLAMWSYYAHGHRGFVIEFDRRHPLFATAPIRSVTYSRQRPRFAIRPLGLERDIELSRQVANTKSPYWQHEREVRITINQTQAAYAGKRDDKGFPILLVPLEPRCIKRVILGCCMVEQDKRDIRRILNEERYTHVAVEYATVHASKFALEFIPYPTPRY